MGDTTSTSEEKRFRAIFDEVMLRQLRKLGEDASLQLLLSQMLDKMERICLASSKFTLQQSKELRSRREHPLATLPLLFAQEF